MMKKLTALILALAMSLSLLAGCTGDGTSVQVSYEQEEGSTLADELTYALSGTGALDTEQINKWKKYPQDNFLPVWKGLVVNRLVQIEHDGQRETGWQEYDWEVKDWEQASNYLNRSVNLYKHVYGKEVNDTFAAFDIAVQNLSDCVAQMSTISKKYTPEIFSSYFTLSGYCSYESDAFYITQRLEDDSILAALEKSLFGTSSSQSSDWVAYNVEYIFDSAFPGDTCYVIHADTPNPFDTSGEWWLDYFDTGETAQLSNGNGFTKTVPIYQMITNTEQIEVDAANYGANYQLALISYQIAKIRLMQDKYAALKVGDEAIANSRMAGNYPYHGEYGMEQIEISLSPSEANNDGYFSITAPEEGWEMVAGQLFQIDTNVYFARDLINHTNYLFGFFEQDGKVMLNYYIDDQYMGVV